MVSALRDRRLPICGTNYLLYSLLSTENNFATFTDDPCYREIILEIFTNHWCRIKIAFGIFTNGGCHIGVFLSLGKIRDDVCHTKSISNLFLDDFVDATSVSKT